MIHRPRGPGQSLRWTPQRRTVYPQIDIVPRRSNTGPLSHLQLEAERLDARAFVQGNVIADSGDMDDTDDELEALEQAAGP